MPSLVKKEMDKAVFTAAWDEENKRWVAWSDQFPRLYAYSPVDGFSAIDKLKLRARKECRE